MRCRRGGRFDCRSRAGAALDISEGALEPGSVIWVDSSEAGRCSNRSNGGASQRATRASPSPAAPRPASTWPRPRVLSIRRFRGVNWSWDHYRPDCCQSQAVSKPIDGRAVPTARRATCRLGVSQDLRSRRRADASDPLAPNNRFVVASRVATQDFSPIPLALTTTERQERFRAAADGPIHQSRRGRVVPNRSRGQGHG